MSSAKTIQLILPSILRIVRHPDATFKTKTKGKKDFNLVKNNTRDEDKSEIQVNQLLNKKNNLDFTSMQSIKRDIKKYLKKIEDEKSQEIPDQDYRKIQNNQKSNLSQNPNPIIEDNQIKLNKIKEEPLELEIKKEENSKSFRPKNNILKNKNSKNRSRPKRSSWNKRRRNN